jgi:hypothetical protein
MLIGEGITFQNESDVEQKLVMPLLTGERYLAIPPANIYPKQYLAPTELDKAAGKTGSYVPDYSIWFHGLPILVVEVKSPDVDTEVGYREACLYARHLNQKYPPSVNPCKHVVATNGKSILIGQWDAQPILRLSLEDLRVGAAGMEGFQSYCAGPILDAEAKTFSSALRSRKATVPFELMGGPPVLNAKRALNSFAADLSPILRLYFSSTPQENIHEIAERAYVSSNEVTEYDRVLESLLKDRIALRKGSIVRPLEPTRKGEPSVARAITNFDAERPDHGQLQIIQGPVGSGKSLFIRRYKDVLQAAADAERTKWAIIDFNTATKADLANVEQWIWQAFVEAFQADNPSEDLNSSDALRRIFARNLQRRKGIYDELAKVSPEHSGIQRANDLAKWQDDQREFARGIAEYVIGSRREILVTVMDNVDRLDLDSQLNAFQVTLSFMALTKAFVILQMRDETYERFKDKPPLDTYRSGITFHISPPRFIDVVKRRLELSLEYLTKEAKDVQRYTLESGVRIAYPKTELGMFLRELYIDLFERRHNISRILESLAGWDVRRALEMFVSVITSGHLSPTAITSDLLGSRSSRIKEHNILTILMRTDYRFASEHSGYVLNILRFEKEWERPDNFLLVEILYYLNRNRKTRGEIGLEGYFTCRRIADELQKYGYVPEDVRCGIGYLLKKQLVSADHMNFTSVDFSDSVRILASGHMHLRVLPERLEYLYGILPTTPFSNPSVARKITDVLTHESTRDSVAGSEKAYAVGTLHEYLMAEDRRRRGRLPLLPMGESGAGYLLKKISECLHQFRTGERVPAGHDSLDL